jgi:putative transposase
MPRAPRLYAPDATVHVVARCNNREFSVTAPEDFATILGKLRGMVRDYEVTLYAYTVMSNHVHLLLQAPRAGTLARPLRWFLTETARAFHRVRQRRGHFWERRYRACLIEDDTYGLAALRYLGRNPVRAGLVQDPTTYPWSSCAAYAQGTPNPLLTFHPSYLGLGRDAASRQRAYTELLAPSADPRADARDPSWTTKRAVGGLAFLARYGVRRGHPRPATPARQNQ